MRLPKNLFGNYTKPKIFLCETDKQKMGVLNTADTHVSLKFNTYSELTFNIDRTYIDTLTGNKNTHLFYDRIEHPRLILLENIGYFQIQAPDMSSDGFRESKTITAYSSEYVLSQKYITDLHINTGEVDSVEVIFSEETGSTLEPVVFYNEANPRLSLLHLALEGVYGWKIGHIDDSLKTLARSFDIDRQSVYDFLMNDVCEKCNCYFVFDTFKNEINIYAEARSAKFIGDGKTKTFTVSPPFYKIESVSIDGYKTTQWEYNKQTGALTFTTTPKSGVIVEVVDGGLIEWETDVFITYDNLAKEMNVSYNADDIKTRLTVTYGDDLDIREINMGLPYITDLSYYYTVDWMGQELYDAYTEYLKKSQTSQTTYTKNSQEMLKISNCQYFEEQRLSMAYSEATTVDSSTIGTYYVKDSSNGGYFFKEVVLPDDYKASTKYYQFDGVKLNSEKVNNLYMAIRDNFKTGSVEKINELADAFEFMNDSDSYGISYLSQYLNNSNAPEKKKSYVMNFLKEMWEQVGRTPLKSLYQATFKTLQSTNIDWAQEHIDPDGNKTYHENYPWYYAILLFLESIDAAIAIRDQQLDKLQAAYDKLQAANIEISNSLLMENNFTEAQLIRLSAFIKEDELHIDDIIETEYDTLEDSFKVKQDAMEAGRIELSKRCQPQLQFSMTMANIYALPEFEPIIHQFQLGKVIKVGLRLETKTTEFVGDGTRKQFVLTPPFYNVKTVSIDGVETTNWQYDGVTGLLTLKSYSAPKSGTCIKIIGNNNYIKQSRLLQVDMGLDDLSDFQAQFGELTDLRSQSDIHADLLSQAIQAGKSVASSQDNWNAGVDKAISTDIKIQQGLLDAATVLKSMDDDQGVEISKYGIKLQKIDPDTGDIDPKQGWITNNRMVYTDNNWLSSKSVFGEYQIKGESAPRWGLLADACIASYIEGSTLVGGKIGIGERDDESYNFSVNYEGHMIAQSADVVGKITASSGAITGDLEISGALKHTNGNYTVQLRGVQENSTESVFHIAEKNGSKTTYPFRINGDGSMSATKGDVGGWSITDSKIYSGNSTTKVCVMQKPSKSSTIVFATGGSSHDDYSTCPFRVTADGKLYSTSGEIGGWTIDKTKIYSGNSTTKYCVMQQPSSDSTIVFAAGGTSSTYYSSAPFRVTADGKLTATSATIEGKITATEGTIGGCAITNGQLTIKDANITGTLNASKISGGTLNCNSITVSNLSASSINTGSMSGSYITQGTVYGNRLVGNTITTAYTSGGINTSLGYADFSHDVFRGADMATAVWASSLRVGSSGTQFTKQTISFIDGLGNTRTFTVLAAASG